MVLGSRVVPDCWIVRPYRHHSALFLFVSAFKDNTSIFLDPLGLPAKFSLQNFVNAIKQAELARALTNR